MSRKVPTPDEVDFLVDPDIIKAGMEAKATPYHSRTPEQHKAFEVLQKHRGDAWRLLLKERFGSNEEGLPDPSTNRPRIQYKKNIRDFDSRRKNS